MNQKKGFTLVELMVAVGVFSLTLVILMTICTQGIKSWKEVTAKQETEHGLSNALMDISENIKNSYYAGITCSKASGDSKGGGFLTVPSAAYWRPSSNDTTSSIFNENMASRTFFENEFNTNKTGGITRNFTIVYFTSYSPNGCKECASLFNDLYYAYCPHKHLVKRWYDNTKYEDTDTDKTNIPTWSDNDESISKFKEGEIYLSEAYKRVAYDKILANNVFAFKAEKIENENAISFSIKSFKPLKNRVQMTDEAFKDSLNLFYYENGYTKPTLEPSSSGASLRQFYKEDDFVEDPASFGSDCMLQMDAVVFPMNEQ